MSDFDYKKYLAEGGIEAKLQEISVNEESVDEGVFGDIGKGIGGVATGIGAGVGATMAGAGVLGFAALEFFDIISCYNSIRISNCRKINF